MGPVRSSNLSIEMENAASLLVDMKSLLRWSTPLSHNVSPHTHTHTHTHTQISPHNTTLVCLVMERCRFEHGEEHARYGLIIS